MRAGTFAPNGLVKLTRVFVVIAVAVVLVLACHCAYLLQTRAHVFADIGARAGLTHTRRADMKDICK